MKDDTFSFTLRRSNSMPVYRSRQDTKIAICITFSLALRTSCYSSEKFLRTSHEPFVYKHVISVTELVHRIQFKQITM